MTTFRLYTRFGYIWYICPTTGDEKQTPFLEIPSSQYAKKSEEMAKVAHFEKYGLNESLALAIKTFMAMDYNQNIKYVVDGDAKTISLGFEE